MTRDGSTGEHSDTLAEAARQALARDGDRPAIECDGRWYTWGDLCHVADPLRVLISARAGPIAFVAHNRPEAVAALLALVAEERTIDMVYAFQSPAALAADLARLRPAAVVATDGLMTGDALDWVRANGVLAIVLLENGIQILQPESPARAQPCGDGPAPEVRILTSGTTGPPKQIPFTHAFFARHHLAPKIQAGDDAYWYGEPPLLLTYPISNITGMFTFLPTLLSGQRAILADRFSLDVWRDWIRRYRPVNAGLPPAAIAQVIEAGIPKEELASVRFVGTGAAPLDPATQQRFEAIYGIPILVSYGATEFGGPVAAMTAALHDAWGARKIGSVGWPLPGVHLRIIDGETGHPLPAGETGLLEVITPRIGPDWIRTADLAVIDEDGFLFLHGRADGAINRGGFKIVPDSVERILKQHPAITDAAVVGRKDARLGEVPVAALVLRSSFLALDVDELAVFVRRHVPATHVPVAWRTIDALPRNASYKLDRLALKQWFESNPPVQQGATAMLSG